MGIFPRIPEVFSKDAAAKGRLGVVQNLGLGMVRHLICGDGDGGLHRSKSSLFGYGLGGVYRPIAALSADHPLDRCYDWANCPLSSGNSSLALA
jgi:hypothetical protein